MNRKGHEDVVYFVGPEVENTPAFSKKTLFVVGKQDVVQIEKLAREYKTPHIFLGANHSFAPENPGDNTYWDKAITTLLDKGFWVSLDYQAHHHNWVLDILNPGIWQSRLFVPLLNVRIPKVQTSSPNLTIKIDDIDFNATNPGVWCIHHHELTDSNRFTDWNEYGNDEVIESKEKRTLGDILETLPHKDTKLPAIKAAPLPNDTLPELNLPEVGLDPNSPSQLKPDEKEQVSSVFVSTAAQAAEVYAEGATVDPLGKEATPKKPKVVKKAEA